MGTYDDITPEALRADLRHFAELIVWLDDEGQLLEATPRLLMVLGELRAKIFAYEVRVTGRLIPRESLDDPGGDGVSRIVEDAIDRVRRAQREWARPWDPDDPVD